jgi:hypothetical protein
MPEAPDRGKLAAQADTTLAGILKAAVSWAQEVPPALTPPVRAVCVRLAEMVADQRHYLAPLPEAQERERRMVLAMVAERLRAPVVTRGIEAELEALADMRLKPTGSWALTASAQTEWVGAAIQFLEARAAELPAADRPDPYWADDVVAGIIASVKALIGADELHARTEAEFAGMERAASPPDEA